VTRYRNEDLTEIGRLFRAKLAQLRAEERPPRRGATSRTTQPPRIELPDDQPGEEAMLRTGKVAALLGVSAHTIWRWAEAGYLPCALTLGGRRRFRWSDVRGAAEQTHPRV
jgi:excisionase family DNA binding protein